MEPTAETKTISVPMRVTILRGKAVGAGPICCLSCQAPLDLYQPDIDSPGRLVGICHGCCNSCGCYHMIDSDDESNTVVVMMPSFATIRDAIVVPPLAGIG